VANYRDRRSDEDLLLAAQGADDDAFGVFYQRRLNAVLAFFLKRTHDPEAAADLAAETFASAILAVDRYDPRRSAAMTWLFLLAQRRLIDALRRGEIEDHARISLGLHPLVLGDAELERVEARAAAAQQTAELAILEELSDNHRHAVEGRILNEESYAELAERLQCSESVVRQRVHRGLTHLRALVRTS